MTASGDTRRVVMISGGSSGIGLAVAREMLARGFAVSIGTRHPEQARNRAGLVGEVGWFRYDAASLHDADEWARATRDRWGRIDAVVASAGVDSHREVDDPLVDDEWDQVMRVNALGPLRLVRATMTALERAGTGRLVLLASLSAKRIRNQHVAYGMSKFAALALSHTVRRRLWDAGVRVTAVCPSFVNTPMSAQTTKVAPEDMIQPETLAHLIGTVIELPNNAAIAELLVNCRLEDML